MVWNLSGLYLLPFPSEKCCCGLAVAAHRSHLSWQGSYLLSLSFGQTCRRNTLKGSSVSARELPWHCWAFAAPFSGAISHVLVVWRQKWAPSSLHVLFLELSKDWPLRVLSIPLLLQGLAGGEGLCALLSEIWGLAVVCLSAWALCARMRMLTATSLCSSVLFLSSPTCDISSTFKSIPSRKQWDSGGEARQSEYFSSISQSLTNFCRHHRAVQQPGGVSSKSGVAKGASWWAEKQTQGKGTPIRKIPSLNEASTFLSLSAGQCLWTRPGGISVSVCAPDAVWSALGQITMTGNINWWSTGCVLLEREKSWEQGTGFAAAMQSLATSVLPYQAALRAVIRQWFS